MVIPTYKNPSESGVPLPSTRLCIYMVLDRASKVARLTVHSIFLVMNLTHSTFSSYCDRSSPDSVLSRESYSDLNKWRHIQSSRAMYLLPFLSTSLTRAYIILVYTVPLMYVRVWIQVLLTRHQRPKSRDHGDFPIYSYVPTSCDDAFLFEDVANAPLGSWTAAVRVPMDGWGNPPCCYIQVAN